MPALYILIIIALSMYVFYRIKAWRTQSPMLKHWISSKAQISLGAFLILFGINRLFLTLSTLIFIISVIFILLGAIYLVYSIKAYKFYLPRAIEEAKTNQAH